MKITDHASDPLISGLTEMTRRIESSKTPFEALKAVLDGLTIAFGGPKACLYLSTQGLPIGQYRVVLLRVPEASLDLLSDPWTDGHLPVHSGGVIAEILRNPHPQIAHDLDWSADRSFGNILGGFRSLMAVPVQIQDAYVNWVLLLHKDPRNLLRKTSEQCFCGHRSWGRYCKAGC